MIEIIKKQLESEQQTKEVLPLQDDFYHNISKHTKELLRSLNNNNSETTNRLIHKQIEMLSMVVSALLKLRLEKASISGSEHLLPEERFVFESKKRYEQSYRTLVNAVKEGKMSYLEYLKKKELKRKIVVRFLKELSEIVGPDLHKYGPYKPGDVATIPWLNARIIMAEGDAEPVQMSKTDYE